MEGERKGEGDVMSMRTCVCVCVLVCCEVIILHCFYLLRVREKEVERRTDSSFIIHLKLMYHYFFFLNLFFIV